MPGKKQNVLSRSELTGLAPQRHFWYGEMVGDSTGKGDWDEFAKGLSHLRNYHLPLQHWKLFVKWFFAFFLDHRHL